MSEEDMDDYSTDHDYNSDNSDADRDDFDDAEHFMNDAEYDHLMDDADEDPDNLAATNRDRAKYTVLSKADIRQNMEDDITRLSSIVSLSKDDTIILLRHYNWSFTNDVSSAWFADEDSVRKTVGLLETPIVQYSDSRQLDCGICFDSYPREEFYSVSCGHLFCGECWTNYVKTSVEDGPGCLGLRCPHPSCSAAVNRAMVNRFSSVQEKYEAYVLRSYIEENKKTKWCPAPGCDFAVRFDDSGSCDWYDVSCLCSNQFCWNCTEEAHRFVDCDTVGKWILKNSSEAVNVEWILANTKPCPMCKKPIEKNQGCNIITCRAPCGFKFCWTCLREQSLCSHGACNRYKSEPKDERRDKVKESLIRYTHYYERWVREHKSRQKAIADLRNLEDTLLQKIPEKMKNLKLEFIVEAWWQIVECRRVLKWTYAYGYYLPGDKHNKPKKELFEYLQGQAEKVLETLHECAENGLKPFVGDDDDDLSGKFSKFQTELRGLTSVTKTHFENLVRALENGLSEVVVVDSSGGSTSSSGSEAQGMKRKLASPGDDQYDLDTWS